MKITTNSISLIPTIHSKVYNVQLYLDFQTRIIGKVDMAGEGTFITTRKESHLFRKTNSLGINYSLLSSPDIHFKNICINYNGKNLRSTREYFLKKGKVFQFAGKGFELQCFVPVSEINMNTAKQFENSIGFQVDLFNSVA